MRCAFFRYGLSMRSPFLNTSFFLLPLICLTLTAGAQQSTVGVMGGGSYYIGELNPYRHFGEEETHFAAGAYYRHPIDKRWVVRGQFLYGKVSGSDANAQNAYRRNRNLHFRSELMEVGGLLELNFHEFIPGNMNRPFSPYLFGGLAYFRMNPEAKYNGQWYELRSLGTEGQGMPESGEDEYHLDQIAIPFGVGFKANLGERVTFSMEWGMRKTFTDHMDDVGGSYADPDRLRQANGDLAAELADRRIRKGDEKLEGKERGDPGTTDWYVFSGAMLSIRLGREGTVCSSFNTGR